MPLFKDSLKIAGITVFNLSTVAYCINEQNKRVTHSPTAHAGAQNSGSNNTAAHSASFHLPQSPSPSLPR